MPVTVRGTDILFNDGSTQVTSALPSSFSAIGSVLAAVNYSASSFFPGNTIAGSSLLYVTGFTQTPARSAPYIEGTNVAVNQTQYANIGEIYGRRTGNVGTYQPSNTTSLPGTYRVLSAVAARSSVFDSYTGWTEITYQAALVQRIS